VGCNQADLLSLYISIYLCVFELSRDLNISAVIVKLHRHVTLAAENTVSIRSQCGRFVGLYSGLFHFHVS